NLGTTYNASGQYDEAEPLLRELVLLQKNKDGADAPATASALAGLGLSLLGQKKYGEAESIVRECLTIREKQLPDSWLTFNARSMLGGAILGQKKYAEAEHLLIEGYEGMLKRQAQIPPPAQVRLTEALQRLVELYEATGQKEKAEQHRQKLKPAESSRPAL